MKDTVLVVDGILVPTRDHTVAEQPRNHRYCTNHQAVIDADTRLVVVVGRPLPGNRNDCKAWEESGAKAAVGTPTTTDAYDAPKPTPANSEQACTARAAG